MKLKKLSIKNLRGLKDVEFDSHSLTTLIGKNNCGKSSVLRAIEMVCGNLKPEFEEFYLRGDADIVIEATFDDLKAWERASPSISALVYNNQLRLKYTASVTPEDEGPRKINAEYTAYKVRETITGWSDDWAGLSAEIKEKATQMEFGNAAKFKAQKNKELIKQKIRDDHPQLIIAGEAEWTADSISFPNALQQALPKIILIPAVRDASEESRYSKTGKTGAFGELMKKLILPEIQAEEKYQDIIRAIDALSERIHSEEGIVGIRRINRKLSEKLSRLIDAKANIKFDNPEIDTVISSAVGLRILDGVHDTPIGLQGHGLQRTLIFSLLEMVAENDAVINDENSRTTIILYEEPELYLHPQMLRKLKSILNTIALSENWQIICSTHSPVFINVADHPESLVILSRDEASLIKVDQLENDPFEQSEAGLIERDALRAALDFHPSVCEVFFAKNVILVEGDTEMAIFKHCDGLLTHCDVDLHKALDCTIVSCGGKWTIPAVGRLLKAFNIPFKVVHDLDRQGLTDEQLVDVVNFHPFKANERIRLIAEAANVFINTDTLEDIWGGGKRDKPYGAIKKISKLVADEQVPERLKELVGFVYQGYLNIH